MTFLQYSRRLSPKDFHTKTVPGLYAKYDGSATPSSLFDFTDVLSSPHQAHEFQNERFHPDFSCDSPSPVRKVWERCLYAHLHNLPLQRLLGWALLIALPSSLCYAWSATQSHPWGLTVHSLLYAVSVIPMAAVYIAAVCMLHLRFADARCFRLMAAPGRMALSNYISQSIIGVVLFYGLGFGLGTSLGLVSVELTALTVFILQIVCSTLWLRHFRFGLLEWLWRMLTYGRYFPLRQG